MTDNRTTELREKLNKLIIELDRLDITLDSPSSGMTLGEYEQEREKLLDGFMQAIAATLGSTCAFARPTDLTDGCAALERIAELEEKLANGTLTAEQVMAIAAKHQPDYCSDTHVCFDWQAIADELNATLGGRECEWVLHEKWPNRTGDDHVYGYETGCGARHTWWPDSLPKFCPTCGGKVKAVKR